MTSKQEHITVEQSQQDNNFAGFCSVKSKEEFLVFLNKAQVIVYGDDARNITMRSFNYYAYSSNAKHRYVSFQIPKKDGSSRSIDAPSKGLKVIQKALSVLLESIYVPNQSAMGFVNGRSIVDNAKAHLGKAYVYNIDLKDFFPSITAGRICARLQTKPYQFDKRMASLIADICCKKNDDGIAVLPQGAPTSPVMTNIVCEKLDYKLQNLAKAFHLTYTRYADDITFSGNKNVFNDDGKFCKKLRHIIEEDEHLKINENKTRLCQRGGRLEVTGITVNSQLNTSRKYMRQVRTMLHNWESLVYEKAQELFVDAYNKTNTKNHNAKGTHHIENVLAGKLTFMSMVKGKDDETYKNLYARFEKLIKKQFPSGSNGILPVTNILDIWENDGIDAALALYEGKINKKDTENVASINAFTAVHNAAVRQVDNDSIHSELDGEIVTLREFFEKHGFKNVVSTSMMRNRDADGQVVMCPTVTFKDGVKLSISTSIVTKEGADIQTLIDELGGEPSRKNGVYRFKNSPKNQYYYGRCEKEKSKQQSNVKAGNQIDGEPKSIHIFFKEEDFKDCEDVLLRKCKYKGKTYDCLGIETKEGKRIFLSARLVSEGFTLKDWIKEFIKPTRDDIGVIRFKNSPDNTYYVSHIWQQTTSTFDEENSVELDEGFIQQVEKQIAKNEPATR